MDHSCSFDQVFLEWCTVLPFSAAWNPRDQKRFDGKIKFWNTVFIVALLIIFTCTAALGRLLCVAVALRWFAVGHKRCECNCLQFVHASDDCNQWIDSVTGLLLSLFFVRLLILLCLLTDRHHFDNPVYCYPTGANGALAAVAGGSLNNTRIRNDLGGKNTLTNLERAKLGACALEEDTDGKLLCSALARFR